MVLVHVLMVLCTAVSLVIVRVLPVLVLVRVCLDGYLCVGVCACACGACAPLKHDAQAPVTQPCEYH